jgi:2-C-methyl-D-erythritol 4-phosphate cytidylyltransferase
VRGAVTALVPAAGRGVRLGAEVPKAFVALCGRSLLWRAVHGLLESGCIDEVVVAVAAEDAGHAADALAGVDRVRFVTGGAQRSDSVRAALDAVPGIDVVLVHDAARCLTPASVIRDVVAAVRAGHSAVVPVLPVTDTVKQVDAGGSVVATVDRSALRVAQTPQGFDAALLRRAHAGNGAPATDDAGLVERLGERVMTVPGHPHAFKITTPFDLAVAEAVLR